MNLDRRRDLGFCTLALAMAAAFGLGSLGYAPASAYFPQSLALVMAATALLLASRVLRNRPHESRQVSTDIASVKTQMAAFAKVFAAVLLYVAAIVVLSYSIATVLFLVAAMALFGERRWIRAVVISVLVTASLALLFFSFLGVAPPESLLGTLELS